MKINYKYQKLTPKIFAGIFCIDLGIYFLSDKDLFWYYFTNLLLNVLFIVLYIMEYKYFKNQYIEITRIEIILNTIPTKKIMIKDILWVGFYSDFYIFRTSHAILRITKSRVNKKDIQKFETFFYSLNTNPQYGPTVI